MSAITKRLKAALNEVRVITEFLGKPEAPLGTLHVPLDVPVVYLQERDMVDVSHDLLGRISITAAQDPIMDDWTELVAELQPRVIKQQDGNGSEVVNLPLPIAALRFNRRRGFQGSDTKAFLDAIVANTIAELLRDQELTQLFDTLRSIPVGVSVDGMQITVDYNFQKFHLDINNRLLASVATDELARKLIGRAIVNSDSNNDVNLYIPTN